MEQWDQLFYDGLGRCQNDLHKCFIGVIDEEHLRPLILSTSIILKAETPDHQVDAVLSNILGHIPEPSSINIGKLGSSSLTSKTCNEVRKTCRIIVERVHEDAETLRKDDYEYIPVLEVDCWNDFRNMWLGGMTKALSNLLGNTMRDELDDIDSQLKVSTSIKSVIYDVYKEFSLCANQLKGYTELFREWIEIYHPGAMLLQIKGE